MHSLITMSAQALRLAILLGTIALAPLAAWGQDFIFLDGFDPTRAPIPGEIIFTEIMANPFIVSDSNGEWFEVFNMSTTVDLALGGCTLTTLFFAGNFETLPALTVARQHSAVFIHDLNPGTNTGVNGDAAFTTSLLNPGDTLTITCNGRAIDVASFPNANTVSPEGHAWSLDAAAYDSIKNDDMSNWCSATASYGPIPNFGSPGSINPPCH